MNEPKILKRGKHFQKVVQRDFSENNKSGILVIEKGVSFKDFKIGNKKRGRMDIFVSDDSDDYVTILEIKSTNWDRINEKNIKRNLYRHSKQLFNYIDKYMQVDKKSVCHGIIYPRPPRSKKLRNWIEEIAMENYAFPVYWFNEIRSDAGLNF